MKDKTTIDIENNLILRILDLLNRKHMLKHQLFIEISSFYNSPISNL